MKELEQAFIFFFIQYKVNKMFKCFEVILCKLLVYNLFGIFAFIL